MSVPRSANIQFGHAQHLSAYNHTPYVAEQNLRFLPAIEPWLSIRSINSQLQVLKHHAELDQSLAKMIDAQLQEISQLKAMVEQGGAERGLLQRENQVLRNDVGKSREEMMELIERSRVTEEELARTKEMMEDQRRVAAEESRIKSISAANELEQVKAEAQRERIALREAQQRVQQLGWQNNALQQQLNQSLAVEAELRERITQLTSPAVDSYDDDYEDADNAWSYSD